MKILVFGNSGSGKSSYARAMALRHGLVHLDLDSIVWVPQQVAVQRQQEEVVALLNQFVAQHSAWVIEGCYGELVQMACAHCTQLVFLNPGTETCLAHNLRRPWEPHKYGSADEQNAKLAQLQAWVEGYRERDHAWSYQAHRRVFDTFTGPKVEYVDATAYAS